MSDCNGAVTNAMRFLSELNLRKVSLKGPTTKRKRLFSNKLGINKVFDKSCFSAVFRHNYGV